MSKEKVMLEVGNLNCELISNRDVSFLEGKLKTFVDATDKDNIQKKATKDIIQTILWDWYCFIRDHGTDHLKEKKDWYKEGNKLDN